MVYHCTIPLESDSGRPSALCGIAILPLRTKAKGPAVFVHEKDVVDEAISFFRANVLFRNFEVKGPADKLLLYLTLYISACLKRLSDAKIGQEQAKSLLFRMAHEPFRIPGDDDFALGGLVSAPATASDEDFIRSYLRQCREEVSARLLDCCYKGGVLNKFWMAYANRRFLNKAL